MAVYIVVSTYYFGLFILYLMLYVTKNGESHFCYVSVMDLIDYNGFFMQDTLVSDNTNLPKFPSEILCSTVNNHLHIDVFTLGTYLLNGCQ